MTPPVETPTPFEMVSPRSVALSRPSSIAIVGAGVSGLACAAYLVPAGFRVRVFDQGRGPGGRISTRRESPFHFDHGAQYFTVRDPIFAEQVDGWIAEGAVALWHGRIRVLEEGSLRVPEDSIARYVGVPRMSALARRLARESRVRCGVRVEAVERRGKRWELRTPEGDSLGSFDLVVVALPAPQAVPLLAGAPKLAARAQTVEMAPTWAVLAGFERSLELAFDGAFVHGSPLSWVARNTSKPGRPEEEGWVLHGSHEWSRRHLEEEAGEIARKLLEALAEATGETLPAPQVLTAQRWRFAAPVRALPQRYLFDRDRGLAACGDWCGGPRVEGAYLSGRALGEAIEGSWGDPTERSADPVG